MTQTAGTAAEPPRGEELRLALVLNGGVSLAVWMGGVAYELNRLVRETHPVYRGLLQLTDTSARIDVISGTSAGGVNGAALALAQIHDTSLYGLREVWLGQAGLEQLMREPGEGDADSLLRGNAYFLPRIEEALRRIAKGDAASVRDAPMMLSLTTTLLHGVDESHLDDFGAVIEDKVHRAHFAFERRDGGPPDPFATHPDIVAELARAARASASFPVAFEPVHHRPPGSAHLRARSDSDAPVLDEDHLLDGGILDNKPFRAALDGISKLPADGNTRRVLAYIVPDPKAATERPPPDANGQRPPPTLAQVAFQSVVGIPGTQSIADHLAEIREHNDHTRRRWQRVTGLLASSTRRRIFDVAALLFPAYQARRIDGAIDHLMDELERGLLAAAVADRDDDDLRMRRATRHWLRAQWLAASHNSDLWRAAIPGHFDPAQPVVDAAAPAWSWGQYTLEFMAEVVIDVLRRTQRLHGLVARWREQPRQRIDGPAFEPRATEAAPPSWEQIDRQASVLSRRRQGPPPPDDGSLPSVWRRVYDVKLRLRAQRWRGDDRTREAGRQGFAELLKAWRESSNDHPPKEQAVRLLKRLRAASSPGAQANEPDRALARLQDARTLCRLLGELQGPIGEILAARPREVRADVGQALDELGAYHRYFFGQDESRAPSLDALGWRLLALEVIEMSVASRDHRPDAAAELVQVSARLASPWGGRVDPQHKLTGMGLAHFAAFYKRSWRANDWTHGRLDGIDRAVRMILNPDRLGRLYGQRRVDPGRGGPGIDASVYVRLALEALAVHGARPDLQRELALAWERDRPAIERELAWLDDPARMPPNVLERCADALTRRLQLEVLMHELPGIAEAIDEDEAIGATPSDVARRLRLRVAVMREAPARAPEIALSLLGSGLLGSDTLRGEAGTDQFTRTVAQGVAVVHATASSARSGLKSLKILLKLTEWPIAVFHWLAGRLSQDSRTNAALEGAMIGVGITLVIAAITAEKLPAVLATLGWGLLAGGLAASLLRHRWLGIVAVAASVALLTLINPAAGLSGLLGGAALLLLLRFSGGLGALLLIMAAAWWSAGRPGWDVIAQLPCAPPTWLRPDSCAAEAGEAAQRLFAIAVPALLVSLMVLCSLWSRHARRLWQRWRRWLGG